MLPDPGVGIIERQQQVVVAERTEPIERPEGVQTAQRRDRRARRRVGRSWPLRTRRRAIASLVVLALLLAGIGTLISANRAGPVRTLNQFVAGTPEPSGQPVQLDTTLYLPAHTPAPAILLAHGFGGSKAALASQARSLARAGYVVLAYSARGFGASGGLIHLDSVHYEVADGSRLLDWLQRQLGLRWLHDVPAPTAAPAPGPWHWPREALLAPLANAVQLGYYRGILNQLDAIEAAQPECDLFLREMRALARHFQFEPMARALARSQPQGELR